tara:strand:+ start:102 stop:308 length:207 start_codon:yes stop_codon:yes gene_type:complete
MKNLIIASIIVLFSTSVFAGSCPMMAKQVDDKIKQAQELRDNAMAAHDSGDHSRSEELLNEALELFKS